MKVLHQQSKYAKAAGDKWTPEELLRIDALRKIGGDETSEFFTEALDARYAKVIEHMGHLVEEMTKLGFMSHVEAGKITSRHSSITTNCVVSLLPKFLTFCSSTVRFVLTQVSLVMSCFRQHELR